jgi:hypothetical protein
LLPEFLSLNLRNLFSDWGFCFNEKIEKEGCCESETGCSKNGQGSRPCENQREIKIQREGEAEVRCEVKGQNKACQEEIRLFIIPKNQEGQVGPL